MRLGAGPLAPSTPSRNGAVTASGSARGRVQVSPRASSCGTADKPGG